jgi:hypothetical protein
VRHHRRPARQNAPDHGATVRRWIRIVKPSANWRRRW